MRSYDAISADALDRSPFSNGTSGEIWMGSWCYTCRVDAAFQADLESQGCPLIMVALMRKTPTEWKEVGLQDYDCSEYIDNDGDDGDDDVPDRPGPPDPENPAQVDLFSVLAEQVTDEVAAFVAADQMGVRA